MLRNCENWALGNFNYKKLVQVAVQLLSGKSNIWMRAGMSVVYFLLFTSKQNQINVIFSSCLSYNFASVRFPIEQKLPQPFYPRLNSKVVDVKSNMNTPLSTIVRARFPCPKNWVTSSRSYHPNTDGMFFPAGFWTFCSVLIVWHFSR